MVDGLTRRADLRLLTRSERMICDAMHEVETMGADEKLTDTVVYLDKALQALGDFIDEELKKTSGNYDG